MNLVIQAALRLRWVVLLLALGVVGWGVWAFQQQPIDAYPDISAQMVQIITVFPGRAPEEVERQVTIPIENAMLGVPRVETVRSRTIFGLSLVQMEFEEGTEAYWARQRVTEQIGNIDLPEGIQPQLGPLATAYGEIYRYELVSDGRYDLIALRTINDWVVTRRLKRVPGVAEVANFGGFEKQFAVTFNQAQLHRYGLALGDVEDAIKKNNAAGGGSVVSRGSMSMVVRGKGQIENLDQIQNIFVKSIGGTPIYLKDIASVTVDAKVPNGIFSKNDQEPSVQGIVTMRKGENPSRVLARVQECVQELNETEMPPGLRIVSYYDRTQLIEATLHTVTHSVSMGITLVVLVLIFFLGRPSMALLVAMTIPFALLFALVLLYLTNIPIGLLSIGAIDFGIIVDGAVIMAENLARRLGESGRHDARGTMAIIRGAAQDMQRPVFVAVSLIMVAFLPLLTLTRIEGLLFRPMAHDYPVCPAGRFDLRLDPRAGAGVFSFPPRLPRVGEPAPAMAHPRLRFDHRRIAQGAVAGLHGVDCRPGAGAGRAGSPLGDRVLAVSGRRRALGPRELSRGDVAGADQRVWPAAAGNRPGVSRREVCCRAGGPQRRRHRPLSAQPDRDDDRSQAARPMEAIPDQAGADRRAGDALPGAISHHPVQLHAADYRQRYRRHQWHVGKPGR